MGQLPGSGDISWLPAHSILKWIGGDISMLDPFAVKSSPNPEYLQVKFSPVLTQKYRGCY